MIVVAFSFLFTACNDDEDDVQPEPAPEELDIVGVAQSDENFSTLVSALSEADLVSALQADGPFTVFAPTNDAFNTFLSNNGFSGLTDIPSDVLTSVLLNHVVSGEFKSTELTQGYVETLAQESSSGNYISKYIDLTDGVTINGSAKVTTADLEATNGVIHVIDEVIAIPTVVTHAVANKSFEILVSALTRSDVTTDYVSILTGDGPFTVFAPTNDAFVALLDSNDDWNELGDIPVEVLETVLNYHVVAGANVLSSSLSDGQVVEALSGDSFTINIDGSSVSIIDENGRVSNIVAVDVQSGNGVIHVIDQVILPQ